MVDRDLDVLMARVVEEVLETMFFTLPFGPCEPDTADSCIEARVTFSGEEAGFLGVRISSASVRTLAGSFLGECEETLSEIQVAQVLCELANMLCGQIVTELGCRGCFELSSPELIAQQSGSAPIDVTAQQSFAVEKGTLTVSLFTGVTA